MDFTDKVNKLGVFQAEFKEDIMGVEKVTGIF